MIAATGTRSSRRVRQVRVAGPEIDRRDAQGGEPGHVGPAVFRPNLPAGGLDQRLGGRLRQAGQRTRSGVGLLDLHVEPVEHLVHVLQRRAADRSGAKR